MISLLTFSSVVEKDNYKDHHKHFFLLGPCSDTFMTVAYHSSVTVYFSAARRHSSVSLGKSEGRTESEPNTKKEESKLEKSSQMFTG